MRRFTPEEDAELKRLWSSRIRDHELASRMGRYIGVLRCRAKKIGLPPSRRTLPEGHAKDVNNYEVTQELLTDIWFHFSDCDDRTLRQIADRARKLLEFQP